MADTTPEPKSADGEAPASDEKEPVTLDSPEPVVTPDSTLSNKEAAAKRQADRPTRVDGNFTSQDTFANPHEKFLHNTATAEDAAGVERIVTPYIDGWKPAPMEATDEQKAAAVEREERLAQAREIRLAQLSGEIKDEDRQENNTAVGGSQSTTA